jgi:hypothetical protein
LVGRYDEVRREISKYIREGFQTFILDVRQSAAARAASLLRTGLIYRSPARPRNREVIA